MYNDDTAISLENIGKMYKLYKNPKDKIKDAFGLNFYKKNYYKEFWVLRDVNITIKKGERVGLIGHNGAGKSTILKIITGNIKPTEGTVNVKGKIQALLEMGTGFHPEFTGRENIRVSLSYQDIKLKNIDEIEEEIIEFTELGEYIDQPVKTYSAGMYSRLAFAVASAVRPELLIIDEVLGAGDAYFNGKCVERMNKLTSGKETTVLFVSHDLQSVQALCDRVIWINKGKIVYDGNVLQGIKLYTQSVRKNEEMRLRIRDMKLSKKYAMLLDRKQDLYDDFIFRLVSPGGQDTVICRVYKISVLADGKEINCIDVGAAMDNNVEEECYIIDEQGMTCWGKSKRDQSGYYREYNNSYGKDRHAPFHIMIGKDYEEKDIEIKIALDIYAQDGIEVQQFDYQQNKYITCTAYAQSDKEYSVKLERNNKNKQSEDKDNRPEDRNNRSEDKSETPNEIVDVSRGLKIDNVVLRGDDGQARKVFPWGKRIESCEMALHFDQKRSDFIFVFCVYSMKGDIVFSTCQKAEMKQSVSDIEIRCCFPEVKLGPGEYTISIAVYDELDVIDNSREQTALALIDRGISFIIEKPIDYNLNIGYFLADNTIEIVGMNEDEVKYSLIM